MTKCFSSYILLNCSVFAVVLLLAGCGGGGGGEAPNLAPVADFTISDNTGKTPLAVSFDASTSSDNDGQISSYSWDFGDGQSGSGVTINHTYIGAGNFTAILTITDNDGATNTSSKVITVNLNQSPVASFITDVNSGVLPLAVSFDASASSDSDGQISNYSWDFGDGQSGSGVTINHTYIGAGNFTAILTITDNDGATNTSSKVITVNLNQSPVASFITDVNSGALPLAVSFDASASSDSDGQISNYSWDFGDGQSGSGVTSSHTFIKPGDFTVTLTVTDDKGAVSITSGSVTVTGTFTTNISGTIVGSSGSFADGDVNDPNDAYIVNDTPLQAQLIPNPVNLGGYANLINTGPAGPSFTFGDRSDFFRVNMTANQSVTLNIADFTTGDLDLYIYHDDGSIDVLNPDYLSIGVGETETITVPTDGSYVIEVYAFSGYTNYNLVIGQSVVSLSTDSLVSTSDFINGDIVVRFSDEALMLSAYQTPKARADDFGLEAKAGSNGRSMLMGLGSQYKKQASLKAMGFAPGQDTKETRQYRSYDPEKQLMMDTLQAIKALRMRSDVLYAEPNYILQAKQVPTDQYYDLQWHYPLINLPSAWDISTGSSDVIVAIVDTGVLLSHPDLVGQFSSDGGYDFIQNDSISQDGEPGIDSNPDDPGDASSIGSSSFHGTHVAGTVAAATNFSSGGIGVVGVAPGAKIMPLRVLGSGGGTSYDINQAVRYAAGLSNDSGTVPANKADVINLSLGGGAYSQDAQDTFTLARNAGSTIVAAAGNESTSLPSYPAAYIGVISVSAVDINKQLAPYSNYGFTVDVAAPGGDNSVDVNGDGYPDGVLSVAGDDSGGSIQYVYKFYQGTSMAAPHVTGIIALMKSVFSDLSPANIDSLLVSGEITDELGTPGRDDLFGYGLINARKAVDMATILAQGTVIEVPSISVSPAALNFGATGTIVALSIVNGGSGSLNVLSISDDVAWLTSTAGVVDVNSGTGSYLVNVDRSGLSEGTYTATITVTSSAGTKSVPVLMQVAVQNIDIDVGYQYVLLIDADTNNVIDQWDGDAQNGIYEYQFNNVVFSDGQSFYIIAGTDMNNDLFICDAGEACGAYLSLDQFKIITASDTHTGLDFVSGTNIGLRSMSVSGASDSSMRIRRQQFKKVKVR